MALNSEDFIFESILIRFRNSFFNFRVVLCRSYVIGCKLKMTQSRVHWSQNFDLDVNLDLVLFQFWTCDSEVNVKRKYPSILWLWPSLIKSATEVRHIPAFIDLKAKHLYIGVFSRYFKIFIYNRNFNFLRE